MEIAVQSGKALHGNTSNSDYLRALGYQDVSIEVNDQCNFHCVYCPYDSDKSHQFAVMDQRMVKEIIDRLAVDHALDGYLLFNVLGEPLMYSGLFDLIKYANSSGLKTKLITNGSLLTKKNIDALIDASPTLLKISVESLDPEVFAELRGTTISFNTYINRISNLISSSIKAGGGFTSYIQMDLIYANGKLHALKRVCGLEANDPGREGLYETKTQLLKDVKVFLGQLIESDVISEASVGDLAPDDAAYLENHVPYIRIAPNIAFHIKPYLRWDDIFARKYPVANDGRGCHVANLGIHASGDVVLCCLDYNASTILGNVFHQSLPDILTTPRSLKIIQDLRQGVYFFDACKSCQGHSTLIGKYVIGARRQKTIIRVHRAVLAAKRKKVS